MRHLLLFVLITASFLSTAQEAEDVVIHAMRDELNRNLKELQLPNHSKPFFIQYSIADLKIHQVMASMGALLRSTSSASRTKASVRILVGDYEFNDESLDNNLYSAPGNNEIALPLENDYEGIRRSLWVTTDNVYKSAARQFSKNEETLRDLNKELKDVPHRSFARQAPFTLLKTHTPQPFARQRWEEYVRNISAVALQYPEIMGSNVALSFSEGYRYTVNSEGTIIRVPETIAVLQASVQLKDSGGLFLYDSFTAYARNPSYFPPVDEAAQRFTQLIEHLLKSGTLPTLQEEYTGPVLIEGKTVAEVLSGSLFGNRETLILSNDIQSASGFRMETTTTEGRIGRSIMDQNITVLATSRTRDFAGVDLLGAYEADSEGVVPPTEIVLVEKGILKNLLNDRTITKSGQTSNGHAGGAGVIQIRVDNAVSRSVLRDRLLAKAKEEGLDHAFIIRATPGEGMLLIRVTPDGQEEVVRGGNLGDVSLKTLRRIVGATPDQKAYHLTGASEQLTSFIVPDAVLFQELSILPAESPRFDEEVLVDNPLKKSK